MDVISSCFPFFLILVVCFVLPAATAAYELRSDKPVQMMLAELELEVAAVAAAVEEEEEVGQEEAGVVPVVAAVGQH